MRRLLPVLLLLVCPAAAASPPVPSYARFGHWFVACDNTSRCEARGYDDSSRADLRVVRPAGDAPPEMTLTADAAIDPTRLELDGSDLALAPPAWRAGSEAGSIASTDPAAVAALLARLRTAHRLALGPGSADGVPLDGLTAALLRMDEVQGRVGTPTPLLAPSGPAPAPPAPTVPRRARWQAPPPLAKGRAARLVAATRKAAAAELVQEGCDRMDDDEAHGLDAGHDLVLLGCALYAYQASRLAYVVPRGGAAVRFSSMVPTLKDRMDTLTEAGFDPATGTLSTSAKGRGLADCGVSVAWTWSGGRFHLVALAYQDPCGGAAPGDWPVLYRTR